MQTSLAYFRRPFRGIRFETHAARLPITGMLHRRQRPWRERKDTKLLRRDPLLDLLHRNARHQTGIRRHRTVSIVNPRMQDVVATNIITRANRNWRYHIDLKMWLTKDISCPEPIQISQEKEQGSYVFFNYMAWEKCRVRNQLLLFLFLFIFLSIIIQYPPCNQPTD